MRTSPLAHPFRIHENHVMTRTSAPLGLFFCASSG
jgi:hypothetical protein